MSVRASDSAKCSRKLRFGPRIQEVMICCSGTPSLRLPSGDESETADLTLHHPEFIQDQYGYAATVSALSGALPPKQTRSK